MNINKLGIVNYVRMMKDSLILLNSSKNNEFLIENQSELEIIYKKSLNQ